MTMYIESHITKGNPTCTDVPRNKDGSSETWLLSSSFTSKYLKGLLDRFSIHGPCNRLSVPTCDIKRLGN